MTRVLTARVLLVLVVLAWTYAAGAAPRLVAAGPEPVEIYVQAGAPLVVTFPEAIQAIPTGADPADLSLEIEDRRLFIQALAEDLDDRLFVIGASGGMYQLHLVERPGEADDQVQLVQPVAPPVFGAKAPVRPGPAATGRRGRQTESPLRRLLVAMMAGEKLPGVSVVEHAQTVLDRGDLEIYTLQMYVAGRYLGYVAMAENRGTAPLALRLPEYRAPGLKAIAAERETLGARGTTLVYLVVEPGRP